MVGMGNLQQKSKEMFYFFTFTLLTLLLPLSFLLLAKFSDAQYYLQTLTWYHSPKNFPYILTLALHTNPLILYVLVYLLSMASLIHGLTGKMVVLSDSLSSSPPRMFFQRRLCIAWVLVCTFQVCVGLGIEGSIEAGLYDSNNEWSFGVERSRVVFLLGMHETMMVWGRMVVRPVVDDTVFGGGGEREERWVERVGVGGSLGALWWWRLREDVESFVEAKEDVRISDFVGWCLYYLTFTIGMVRLVKSLVWMANVSLRRTTTGVSSLVQHSRIDHKL